MGCQVCDIAGGLEQAHMAGEAQNLVGGESSNGDNSQTESQQQPQQGATANGLNQKQESQSQTQQSPPVKHTATEKITHVNIKPLKHIKPLDHKNPQPDPALKSSKATPKKEDNEVEKAKLSLKKKHQEQFSNTLREMMHLLAKNKEEEEAIKIKKKALDMKA